MMVCKSEEKVSTNWPCYPNLTLLVGIYIVAIEIDLINDNLFVAFLLPTYIHSSKSESVSF